MLSRSCAYCGVDGACSGALGRQLHVPPRLKHLAVLGLQGAGQALQLGGVGEAEALHGEQ